MTVFAKPCSQHYRSKLVALGRGKSKVELVVLGKLVVRVWRITYKTNTLRRAALEGMVDAKVGLRSLNRTAYACS